LFHLIAFPPHFDSKSRSMNPLSLHYKDQYLHQKYLEASNPFICILCKISLVFCSIAWLVEGSLAASNFKLWTIILMFTAFVSFTLLYLLIYKKKLYHRTFLSLLLLTSLVAYFEVLIDKASSSEDNKLTDMYILSQQFTFINVIVLMTQISWIFQALITLAIQAYFLIRLYYVNEKNLQINPNWFFFILFELAVFYLYDKSQKENFLQTLHARQDAEQYQGIVEDHIPEKVVILSTNLQKVLFFNRASSDYFKSSDNKQILQALNELKPKAGPNPFHDIFSQQKIDLPSGFLETVSNGLGGGKGLLNTTSLSTNLRCSSEQRLLTLNDYQNTKDTKNGIVDVTLKPIVWNGSPSYLLMLNEINEKDIANRLKLAEIFKNRLLASFSNEFRTPLNAILGFTTMLKKRIRGARDLNILDMVESSAKVLLLSVDSLLDLMFLVKEQKLKIEVKPLRTKVFMQEIQQLIFPYLHNKNVKFHIEISTDVPEVIHTDATRLKEALIHLLLNAIKFTYHGQVTLTLSKCPEDPEIVFFSVEDTGIGIKKEDLRNIFKMDLRDDPKEMYQKGVGLGLLITSKLASLLGKDNSKHGNLVAESEFGKGSKFTFGVHIGKFLNLPHTEVIQKASEEQIYIDFNFVGFHNDNNLKASIIENANADTIPIERGRYDKRIKVFTTHRSLDFGGSEENIRHDFLHSGEKNSQSPKKPLRYMIEPKINNDHVIIAPQDGRVENFADFQFQSEEVLPLPTKYDKEKYQQGESTSPLYPGLPQFSSMHHLIQDKSFVIKTSRENTARAKDSGDKILVVDDTPFNLIVAKTFLEELGFHVKTALNGQEAIDMAVQEDSTNFYKLIFMDCQMPVLDGYQATEILKDKMMKSQIPLTPIVAITANKNPRDIDRCYECGMDGFLSKPVTKESLKNQIKEIFPEIRI